ncbi:GTP-binding protein [Candidatus Bathyarchaeota archaeon]|nr:GTP-binding protein [Candidatus Bathyarchaeota archaeon]
MSTQEKIRELEEELARTPVNKGTNRHLGVLRARIARLREQEEERIRRSRGQTGEGYTVRKDGDATVVLLGMPSVGKSTLLNQLTNSKSKVGAYDFTTLTVIPGILKYKGAMIQVLDIPGIIKGASEGKGLGKRILSVTRNADLLLIMVDIFNTEIREILLKEIRDVGIRPDENPPDITIEKRGSGGVVITDMVGMTEMDKEGMVEILREYKYHNSRVVVREDMGYDRFVDALLNNTVYIPTLTVVNKIDMVDKERVEEHREKADYEFVAISAENETNLDTLKEKIFQELDLIRIYMRPKGEETDYEEPLIVKRGSNIEDIADKIHGELKRDLRYTRVWGKSVKFGGQKVGLDHIPIDEDIITFY